MGVIFSNDKDIVDVRMYSGCSPGHNPSLYLQLSKLIFVPDSSLSMHVYDTDLFSYYGGHSEIIEIFKAPAMHHIVALYFSYLLFL